MLIPLGTLDRSVRLIDALNDLDDPSGFGPAALPLLARIIGCDVATFNTIGRLPNQVEFADHPHGALAAADPDEFARHVHEHPLVNYYRRTHDGRPVKFSDFLTRPELHRLSLYNNFFRIAGLEHQIAFTVATPASEVVGFALNRARHDFTDADRDLLTILRTPLMAALLRGRRRAAMTRTTTTATQADQLTARERQVLQMVAQGRTNTAIAHALQVSPRTVAKHLEHAYHALHVNNRAAAVATIVSGQGGPRR